MSLPERQQQAVPQPFEVRPAVPEVYRPQPIQPVPERRIVGYERYADGMLVPVFEVVQQVERTPERDLTPAPLIDPIAQRLGCGALLAVGVGVGGMLLFNVWTAVCLGSIALIVIAMKLPAMRGGVKTINVTNNNRWWGRSSSPIK